MILAKLTKINLQKPFFFHLFTYVKCKMILAKKKKKGYFTAFTDEKKLSENGSPEYLLFFSIHTCLSGLQ